MMNFQPANRYDHLVLEIDRALKQQPHGIRFMASVTNIELWRKIPFIIPGKEIPMGDRWIVTGGFCGGGTREELIKYRVSLDQLSYITKFELGASGYGV
jgi:hypothetical protein